MSLAGRQLWEAARSLVDGQGWGLVEDAQKHAHPLLDTGQTSQ